MSGQVVIARDLQPAPGGLAATTLDDYVAQIGKVAGPRPDVLIGASMGGALVLKAAEQLKPRALVLVCSAIPAGVAPVSSPKEYPEIMKWAGGPYEETVAAMPDSEEAIRRMAHSRWRDESGAVLRAIAAGMKADRPECPTLCVIPEGDDSIAPGRQQALASWAQADTLRFQGMSHVGPLLSRRASEVAGAVTAWLEARLGRTGGP